MTFPVQIRTQSRSFNYKIVVLNNIWKRFLLVFKNFSNLEHEYFISISNSK